MLEAEDEALLPIVQAAPDKVHSQLGRVLRNFISLSGGELMARALTFLSTVYLARTLGTEGFGAWQFALAVLGYFMLIADAGFDHFGQREIARDRTKLELYAGNLIVLRLLLAALGYALLWLTLRLWPQSSQSGDLLALYGLTLFAMPFSLKWAFWGLERMRLVALGNMALQFLLAVGIFGLVHGPADLNWLALIQIGAEFSVAAGLLAVFYRLSRVSLALVDWRLWPGLLRQALPMALSQLMGLVRYNFDVVLLGLVLGELYVGWYSAAYRIITLLMLFVTAYSTATLPTLARFYGGQATETQRFMALSLRIMAALTLPLAIGGTLLARPLLEVVFGRGYEHSAIAFQFLVWSVTCLSLSAGYRLLLRAFNFQNLEAKIVTLAAALNIALNFLLIIPWGLIGVAAATVLGEMLLLALAWWQVQRRLFAVPLLSHLIKPGLACLPMALYLVLLSDWSIFFLIPTGGLIYLAGLGLLGGLTWQEVRFVLKRNRS